MKELHSDVGTQRFPRLFPPVSHGTSNAAKRSDVVVMVLSSDELEILTYLKSWNGEFVNVVDISRSCGSRERFKEFRYWAGSYMSRLIEANLVEVNERGHFRALTEQEAEGVIIGDDYFPAAAPSEPVAAQPPPPPPPPQPSKSTAPARKRWITTQKKTRKPGAKTDH